MATKTTLFDLLEREWTHLSEAPTTCRTLRRWGTEDQALAFASMQDLMAHMARRDRPQENDAVMPALVRRADSEEMAARVLLQLLLPGCKSLAGRYAWMGEPDEVASQVVVAVYERIRAYPLRSLEGRQVCRGWVAADILMSARQHLWRRAQRLPSHREICMEESASDRLANEAALEEVSAGEQLVALLEWAVKEGHLSRGAAQLIAKTRLEGVPVARLAAELGESPQVTRRRRLRAEHRLRAAATAMAAA